MAEKPSWIRWLLLGLAVFGVMCLASGLAVWKFGGTASRYLISRPLPAGETVSTPAWTLTAPSPQWRQLTPQAEKGMPVKKDAWLIHLGTGSLLSVEGVESGGNNQHIPARLANAMVDQQKRDGVDFEMLASSEFETCGAPAQLREYRVTRDGTPMIYAEATYASRGHGYVVTAWGEAENATSLRDELVRGATGFCPNDSDYDREWLRNFFIVTDEEPFKSAFAEGQRALATHSSGIRRLSRRELVRFVELQLAMTKDVDVEACSNIFTWRALDIEAALQKLSSSEVRDWFRIARHAQQAVLEDTMSDEAADEAAQDRAFKKARNAPVVRQAIDEFDGPTSEAACVGSRAILEYALSLDGDERDALLRVVVVYE